MSLHVIHRPMPALFSIGSEKEIRELVERALNRGWCKRPAKLGRDEELEALRQRIVELESEAVAE